MTKEGSSVFPGAPGMKTDVKGVRVTGEFICADVCLFLFFFLLSTENAQEYFF